MGRPVFRTRIDSVGRLREGGISGGSFVASILGGSGALFFIICIICVKTLFFVSSVYKSSVQSYFWNFPDLIFMP